jgi:hypothetical protein
VSEDSACRGRSIEAVRRREAPPAATPDRPRRQARPTERPASALSLAELQSLFQRAVIEGDDAVLDLIADSSREGREVLFGVYRHAYKARLVEILRNDYAELARVAGDAFETLALAYVEAHPSRTQNARWFGTGLPEFLVSHASQGSHPEFAEIAAFTRALNDAFDAADATLLTLTDLARVPPAMWGGLVFTPHPSLRRVDLETNALALWTWAQTPDLEATCPPVERLAAPDRLAIYRPELTPRYRRLAYEEAMMLDEMTRGVAFAGLCEMVGTYGGERDAALRAATHLKVWIEQGMLCGPAPD